jgi:Fic family protein
MEDIRDVIQPLSLVEPDFSSSLTDLIIELDYLRRNETRGTTPPWIFFQLKEIFHLLESIGSARIEGNNTTVAEYIETKIENQREDYPQPIREIMNMEETMDFIEEAVQQNPIDRAFISQLHMNVVSRLEFPPYGEGDRTPGKYRKSNIRIHQSAHRPPDFMQVEQLMNELIRFINENHSSKYDLLKIAITHHRFVWIHPFSNGNGRTVRLLTYAMLIKAGFITNNQRLINPTAVFCHNRNHYYENLAQADTGERVGMLVWCEYVLKGLREEIRKIDSLADYTFLKNEVLLPMLVYSYDRKYITSKELSILRVVVEKKIIQAADIKHLFEGKSDSEISRQIRNLIQKKMIMPIEDKSRKYHLRFHENYLLRGIMHALDRLGFLP